MELAGHRQAQTTMRYVNVTTDMKSCCGITLKNKIKRNKYDSVMYFS
jgi:hypothetical protein